jgi:hypothetical protein
VAWAGKIRSIIAYTRHTVENCTPIHDTLGGGRLESAIVFILQHPGVQPEAFKKLELEYQKMDSLRWMG